MLLTELVNKRCRPSDRLQVLTPDEVFGYSCCVPGWQVSDDGKKLSRAFVMKNFMAAVRFIGRIAEIAEKEDHHPDIHLTGYRNLNVELSTHALNGLTENDFIVAARINTLSPELKG